MKKTILYIIPHLQSTGPVQQLYNLVKNLDMEFFIPKILTLYHERQNSMVTSFEQLGIEVLRLNARKKDLIGCMVGIQRTINSLHPDIIHTETAVADILYYFVLFKKKVPWVTTIHNYAYEDFPMAYGKLVGLILANFSVYAEEKANARVACSKTVCEKYESNKKFSLQYIQNGVDTDTWNTINKNPVYEGEHRRRCGRTDDSGNWKTGNRGKRRAGKREKDCLMRAVFFQLRKYWLSEGERSSCEQSELFGLNVRLFQRTTE